MKKILFVVACLAALLVAVPSDAGVYGGPRVGSGVIGPGYSQRYVFILNRGETTVIHVSGNGQSDLDCFLYDENGNLEDSDTDSTDECILESIPAWTGPFQVRIDNVGSRYNGYRISTN